MAQGLPPSEWLTWDLNLGCERLPLLPGLEEPLESIRSTLPFPEEGTQVQEEKPHSWRRSRSLAPLPVLFQCQGLALGEGQGGFSSESHRGPGWLGFGWLWGPGQDPPSPLDRLHFLPKCQRSHLHPLLLPIGFLIRCSGPPSAGHEG